MFSVSVVVGYFVNPLSVTRVAWRKVARDARARLVEVEMICSDLAEHRRRAETRSSDIEGHRLPRWADIVAREYEPWDRNRIVIDSAGLPLATPLLGLEDWRGLTRINLPAVAPEDPDLSR